MASTVLAEVVGYPGSSVAFAQLLSGMERSGLIEREIRGKRTYRISAAPAAELTGPGSAAPAGAAAGAPASSRAAGSRTTGRAGSAGVAARRGDRSGGAAAAGGDLLVAAGAGDLDYDELARRLLVQVVQRLADAPAGPGEPDSAGPSGQPAGDGALQQAVASLEQKLASIQSRQRRLTAENAKLREQLRAAQQSLAEAQERPGAGQLTGQLDSAEVLLLERLLSPLREQRDRREEAGAS
jgi:hypothetical protein